MPVIRCSNCESLFKSDEYLDRLKDEDNEEYLGCATCQTDMYLMDIEEDEQNGR